MAVVEKNKAIELTNEIKAAIDGIFKKYGMDAPKVRSTYGDYYKLTLESTPLEVGPGGINLNSPEAQYYTSFGYKVYRGVGDVLSLTAPLGTKFTSRGETYVFAGIAAKRKKYPIVGINVETGETTLFTDALIPRLNAAG